MSDQVEPFQLAVPDAQLADLRDRLANTRWPERETVEDGSQGPPLGKVQTLCEHWQRRYDWRRCEAMLNGFGQFRTTIDDLGIHFLHVRSTESDALPLILTHGWPGSVIEFHKVIGPLTNPVAHGGTARDAFHLVIPLLPGFGFSDKPTRPGWNLPMLDDIMLYWLPNTGASAARLYWETRKMMATVSSPAAPVRLPAGFSIFPKDVMGMSRRWLERRYANVVHFNELTKGGHYAAMEQPSLFVDEIRESFRNLR